MGLHAASPSHRANSVPDCALGKQRDAKPVRGEAESRCQIGDFVGRHDDNACILECLVHRDTKAGPPFRQDERLLGESRNWNLVQRRQRMRRQRQERGCDGPFKVYLDAMKEEKSGLFILMSTRNKPWTEDGVRSSWGKAFVKAKINEDLTFHDLRGSAVIRLALARSTVPEIATFTGHSLKDVEGILDKHYLGRDVRLAESAARKLDAMFQNVTFKEIGERLAHESV